MEKYTFISKISVTFEIMILHAVQLYFHNLINLLFFDVIDTGYMYTYANL